MIKKVLLAILIIAAVFITSFTTTLLLPPFKWSHPAADILVSSNRVVEALNSTIEKNRNTTEKLVKVANGDNSICPPYPTLSNQDNLKFCLRRLAAETENNNATLEKALTTARETVSKNAQVLKRASNASDGLIYSLFDQIKRLLKWIGPSGTLTIAGISILAVALTRRSFWTYFDGNASVNLGSVVLNLSNINRYRTALADRYFQLDGEIAKIYREKVSEQNLEDLFSQTKKEIDKSFQAQKSLDLSRIEHRSTLYVPSLLQQELVQATSYLGHKFSTSKGGVGRRFSVRYGIIGKSWRLRRSLYNPAVTNDKNKLIRHWGFTWDESAKVGDSNQALISFVIKSKKENSDPLGVIYLEGSKPHVFGPKVDGTSNSDGLHPEDLDIEQVWSRVTKTAAAMALSNALEKLQNELHSDEKLVKLEGR